MVANSGSRCQWLGFLRKWFRVLRMAVNRNEFWDLCENGKEKEHLYTLGFGSGSSLGTKNPIETDFFFRFSFFSTINWFYWLCFYI